MSHESPRNKNAKLETRPSADRVTEEILLSSVHEQILEGLADSLEEAGFTPEQEQDFRSELSKLSLSDVNGVLSMPYELKQTRLPKLAEKIRSGVPVTEIVRVLADEAKKMGYTLGYHMSNSDIMHKRGRSGAISWIVDGREQDHRDNDLPMAYYSTSLSKLYGAKRARFLYIVRSETGEGTTHKQDNDGSWGRATKLDIVEKSDYELLMSEARKKAKQLVDTDEKIAPDGAK